MHDICRSGGDQQHELAQVVYYSMLGYRDQSGSWSLERTADGMQPLVMLITEREGICKLGGETLFGELVVTPDELSSKLPA